MLFSFLSRTLFHNFGPLREIESLVQFKECFFKKKLLPKTASVSYVAVFYDLTEDIWNLIVDKIMHKVKGTLMQI